ncbi:MAG: hypothetical protein HZC37_29260 [Burkholderiales bacterium]|nr:hypothetical protein [Burkholderiales bacterium]
MLRLLIVVAVVVGLVLWFLKGRRIGAPPGGRGGAPGQANAKPAPMVACAHCGVHLPRPDASFDAEGRSYCGEAHRVAGPR